jgi:hypothetical protein
MDTTLNDLNAAALADVNDAITDSLQIDSTITLRGSALRAETGLWMAELARLADNWTDMDTEDGTRNADYWGTLNDATWRVRVQVKDN